MNIHANKDESIRWMNALNWSTSIVSAMISNKPDGDIKLAIKDVANFLYNLEPDVTDLQDKINKAQSIDELDSLKEEVAKTDSVSIYWLWNERKIKLWQ